MSSILSRLINLAGNITGTLPIANGGTAVTSVTTAPAATAFAGWDGSKNLSANSFIDGYTTTATAAATTTLDVTSTQQQFFTGSTTQTVKLPVTSTLVLGQSFIVVNNSSGIVTVQSSGSNTVKAMGASSTATFTVILTSGTTAASWNVEYAASVAGTVTSVDISVPTLLSVSGNPITTSGTLALTYSGTALPIVNGGSGQTTANTALNAFLPSQTSNSGSLLTSDGTNTSWNFGWQGASAITSTGADVTLTVSSPRVQTITASGSINVNLPTTSIIAGDTFIITGVSAVFALTFKASGGTAFDGTNGAAGSVGDPTIRFGSVKFIAATATPTTPGGWIVASIDEQEQSFTSTFTFNGTGTPGTSAAKTIYLTRHNQVVTLNMPQTLVTTGVNSTTLTANTAIPSRFRPGGSVLMPILMRDAGVNQTNMGTINVPTSGVIVITKDNLSTAFTASTANCGPVAGDCMITYMTNQ